VSPKTVVQPAVPRKLRCQSVKLEAPNSVSLDGDYCDWDRLPRYEVNRVTGP